MERREVFDIFRKHEDEVSSRRHEMTKFAFVLMVDNIGRMTEPCWAPENKVRYLGGTPKSILSDYFVQLSKYSLPLTVDIVKSSVCHIGVSSMLYQYAYAVCCDSVRFCLFPIMDGQQSFVLKSDRFQMPMA